MLSPAPTPPAQLQTTTVQAAQVQATQVQAPRVEAIENPSRIGPPATYGALMAATCRAVEDALALGAVRLPDAWTGARELVGYGRFLRYAGHHLHTLMRLAEIRNDGMHRLIQRLDSISDTDPTSNSGTPTDRALGPAQAGFAGARWVHAAALLGTAHDLLATHLTAVGVPRTPEGEDILTGPNLAPACVEVATLILTAVDGSNDLIHRTAQAQKRLHHKPLSTATLSRWYAANRAASLYTRAALWDLDPQRNAIPSQRPGGLEDLRAAIRLDQPPPAFTTTLAALQLLRHYSYSQAHGSTPASPASLRDLTLLGARITHPQTVLDALLQRPAPATGLDRLHRAHLSDQLATAHHAWTTAGEELTGTVQGLTKAPAGYAAAIRHLLHADLTSPQQRALLTVLPSMGTDAAHTVEHLAGRAELVTLQRPPLATRHEWRPILPDHATAIANRFATAAAASRHAVTTLSRIERSGPRLGSGQVSQRLDAERHRQLPGQVAR